MPSRDGFDYLVDINKASAVMVVETGIVPPDIGSLIAKAIDEAERLEAQPGAARATNYLAFERHLIQYGGHDVTRVHSGRSRQDIGATLDRLVLRELLLNSIKTLNDVRAALLGLAERHKDAIVPAYTWGVQAQPITFGHHILAYVEASSRLCERMHEAYRRLNRSPLGSAALGTSSFPVDRERLATLLGMDGIVLNSLDAIQLSPIDDGSELAGIAASTALVVGAFVADITAQYSRPHPWIMLTEGELTGVSSIMPQKRNPSSLAFLRAKASLLIGAAQSFYLLAHNIQPGMSDYKPSIINPTGAPPVGMLRDLAALLGNLAKLVPALLLNEKRALDEVNADYSTTTELADTLQRDADIPFRVGHHFASELVTYGRQRGLRPAEIEYEAARVIFAEATRSLGIDKTELPLAEGDFKRALTAENMIASSKGLGGPQPSEVTRMLCLEHQKLSKDLSWSEQTDIRLENAAKALQSAFADLHR